MSIREAAKIISADAPSAAGAAAPAAPPSNASSTDLYERMGREMARSVFCLVPPGDTSATSRFVTAVAAGCVPVQVALPGFQGPFGYALPWPGNPRQVPQTFLRALPYERFWVFIDSRAFKADPLAAVQPLLHMDPIRIRQLQAALTTQRGNILLQASGAVIGAATRLLEHAAD